MSISMPRHTDRVNFEPDKNKSHFRPLHKNQVSSVLYTEIKSISTPHNTPNQFHPYTEIKPSSISRTKTYKFGPQTKINQVNFDPRTNTELISIPTRKPRYQVDSMPWHKNRGNFDPDTKNKSFSTTNKTTKLISYLHLNEVKAYPPHWNQVNFDHSHKNQSNFDAHTKTKWFTAHTQK